jgi:hypothetical protein
VASKTARFSTFSFVVSRFTQKKYFFSVKGRFSQKRLPNARFPHSQLQPETGDPKKILAQKSPEQLVKQGE